MRRTLSSKLLALSVDTGTRQRILGHLGGTTIDRHYSDDGLRELKAILDRVDYGLKAGRVPQFGFPIILGCSTPVLPSIDVLVSLTDEGEVCALRLCDPETDETIVGGRIVGKPSPKDESAKKLPILSAREIATQVHALQMDYSFTLPTCEASTAGFEHLLIHGVLPAPKPAAIEQDAATDAKIQENTSASQPSAFARNDTDLAMERDGSLEAGDTAICLFPLKRRGNQNGKPRPGLVVAVRTLGGRRYLDVAQGTPAISDHPAPHHFVLKTRVEIAAAMLRQPTSFDLRRRMLVAEDDTGRIHSSLGSLERSACKRLGETMSFVGNVSPEPVSEQSAAHITAVQVVRRSGKVLRKLNSNEC